MDVSQILEYGLIGFFMYFTNIQQSQAVDLVLRLIEEKSAREMKRYDQLIELLRECHQKDTIPTPESHCPDTE